jgi:protein arginine N-methyltransferase 1
VHAVEHSRTIEAAESVARANRLDGVTFHRMHSSKLRLPEKVDVILHEQIGEAAYDERVVENVSELRDRLLGPGGLVLPGKLDLFVEPVQLHPDLRAPFLAQQRVGGIDFGCLRGLVEPTHDYLWKAFRPFPFGRFLCDPAPVVSLDLARAAPADLPGEISYRRPVAAPGIIDGYCVYFATRFDEEIGFSSAPTAPGTSWGNILMRVESAEVGVGDEIALSLTAEPLSDTDTWRWATDAGATIRSA